LDSVIRGVVVYLFLLLVFRLAGKRSLASITVFDFVLVLIISETVQQALIDNDNSMTNAALLVITLIAFDIFLATLKDKSQTLHKIFDSNPVVIIRQGEVLRDRMEKERVSEDDVLAAARELQGTRRIADIDYAVLEESGQITIIPKRES
jgi:uncharacterized membrane protein YcaP (DUF421 family)